MWLRGKRKSVRNGTRNSREVTTQRQTHEKEKQYKGNRRERETRRNGRRDTGQRRGEAEFIAQRH